MIHFFDRCLFGKYSFVIKCSYCKNRVFSCSDLRCSVSGSTRKICFINFQKTARFIAMIYFHCWDLKFDTVCYWQNLKISKITWNDLSKENKGCWIHPNYNSDIGFWGLERWIRKDLKTLVDINFSFVQTLLTKSTFLQVEI